MTDFENAVLVARRAVEVTPQDHPEWPRKLSNLAVSLGDRHSHTSSIADLEDAIRITRQAIDATPGEHPDRVGLLSNLGRYLGTRYLQTNAVVDLEIAIHIARQVVEVTSKDSPHRAGFFNNLGNTLNYRYLRTGAIVDLNECIQMARQAVDAVPEDYSTQSKWLINLSHHLGHRYLRTGFIADLDEAIRNATQAIEATPKDHPERTERLSILASHFSQRYSRTGTIADLEKGISIARQVLNATPEGHSNWTGRSSSLTTSLRKRYSRTGAMADLNEAIQIARHATETIPNSHSNRAVLLSNLETSLTRRYYRTGALSDLNEAIHISREAVGATPEGLPNRAALLNNLGNNLGSRYSHTGAMADLEEAIHVAKQAVKAIPDDHTSRVLYLNNLGLKLTDKYLHTGIITNLDEAISVTRQAVNATPNDHPDRPGRLSDLGLKLGYKYRHTGAVADLEEAIYSTRQAVEATPEDHPSRAMYLNNLASALDNGYRRIGAIENLAEAILILRQAVEATPANHPNRATMLNSLGNRLGARYSRTGVRADLEDSHKCFMTALNFEGAIMRTRINAGRHILSHPAILQNGIATYHIARTAISLVPLSAPYSLQSADKQHLLSQTVGLASDAAAVALHVGQGPISAIDLLETGRGVIASSLQDIRTDLSSLQEEHPELAQSFVELRNLLDAPMSSDYMNTISPATSPPAIADQRHQASSRMTALISEICRQPGFETFLMAATEAQMRKAAAQGPIVIINVSRHRCDALIIEEPRVRALELHQLTRKDITSRARQFKSPETLIWLWTVVAKPVLNTLGFTKTPADDKPWPHVWWIPTGPLVRFPLHAAGNHLQSNSETVLDRVVSSYASSVKSIINTRQQPQKPIGNQDLKVVLVAMQKTPSQSVLHHATNEVDIVRGICTSIGVPHRQPQPYQKAVLDDLNTCRVFHFAGHGSTHPTDPLQSRLLLKDWEDNPLSVGNLLDKTNFRSTSPFLAYLSACGTGQILDDKSVDESIHLTSAFQLAGFRHVIGTLWEVDDALCVDMARMTYEFMSEKRFSDESVAYGLHHAMRTLRDQWVTKVESSGAKQKRDAVLITDTAQSTPTWVPYVHYGV